MIRPTEISKLVVMTRGRTGSTAIVNQLGKADKVHSEQEIFMGSAQSDLTYYPTVLPFSNWKQSISVNFFTREVKLARSYLDDLHRKYYDRGYDCFVWKVLSSHLKERPYLIKLLKSNEYRVLYLKRNVICQVVSGMVATARGV